MGERLDRWISGGGFTRTSLARYRVLYASVYLLLLPDFSWISAFPDSFYDAPPGPMMLFSGFPPESVLLVFEAAVAVCMVAVLIGWRTRAASFLVVGISMVGYGFTYALGKIDHDILLVLVPAAMALAGWGDRLSVDAVRRRARGLREPEERAVHWPLRLYALMIALAFMTAALPKISGGWLDPRSQAVQAIHARQYFTHGRDEMLATTFLGVESPVLWEIMDVLTILLEVGLLLAVLSWASTRVGFAIAATFHLGVWLMMNIPFWMNVVTYAFVVPWDRVPTPSALRSLQPSPRAVRAAPLVALVGGTAWAALIEEVGNAADAVYPVILVGGGLLGATYLAALGIALLRALRDPGDVAAGRLVYDADCGFCTRSAQWLAARRPDRVTLTPWQGVPDLAALGLTPEHVSQRAYWQYASGAWREGSQAIAAAMVARGGWAAPAGRAIGRPPLSPLADEVYRWVARHRHALPGSTDACRVPAPRAPSDSHHRAQR